MAAVLVSSGESASLLDEWLCWGVKVFRGAVAKVLLMRLSFRRRMRSGM